MNKFSHVISLIMILSVFSFAQNSDDYNKNEFYSGYSYQFDTRSSISLNGFEVSYVRNMSRYFGVKGDVSGTFRRKTKTIDPATTQNRDSTFNFLAGVQIKDNSSQKRLKPFAHVLIGVGSVNRDLQVICNSCTPNSEIGRSVTKNAGFAAAFGGGLDIKLNKKIDLRVIQVDYNPVYVNNRKSFSQVRFSVGIVFK